MSKASEDFRFEIKLTDIQLGRRGEFETYRADLIKGESSVDLRFLDQSGMPAAAVYVEIDGDRVVAYTWGPDDEDEPQTKTIVVDGLRAAMERKDEEDETSGDQTSGI